MAKLINLTKGEVAIVDDADFDWLNQWKWQVAKSNSVSYAIRTEQIKRKKVTIRMHRVILCLNDSKLLADHKDGNGLNNQRSNLRVANHSQNCANSSSWQRASSSYLGVSYRETIKKSGKVYRYWRARISKNRKSKSLGNFKTEERAALAYNKAAVELHGDFARLNVIPNP